MPLERTGVHRALVTALGFQLEEGTRHDVYVLRIGNKNVAKTVLSRGSSYRTLSDALVAAIARQIHCPRQMLESLVRGTVSREDYLRNLMERGIILKDDLN